MKEWTQKLQKMNASEDRFQYNQILTRRSTLKNVQKQPLAYATYCRSVTMTPVLGLEEAVRRPLHSYMPVSLTVPQYLDTFPGVKRKISCAALAGADAGKAGHFRWIGGGGDDRWGRPQRSGTALCNIGNINQTVSNTCNRDTGNDRSCREIPLPGPQSFTLFRSVGVRG